MGEPQGSKKAPNSRLGQGSSSQGVGNLGPAPVQTGS